jgi:hypothetical protein
MANASAPEIVKRSPSLPTSNSAIHNASEPHSVVRWARMSSLANEPMRIEFP